MITEKQPVHGLKNYAGDDFKTQLLADQCSSAMTVAWNRVSRTTGQPADGFLSQP